MFWEQNCNVAVEIRLLDFIAMDFARPDLATSGFTRFAHE